MSIIGLPLPPIHMDSVVGMQFVIVVNLGDGGQTGALHTAVHDLLPLVVLGEIEILVLLLRGGRGGGGRGAVSRRRGFQRQAPKGVVERTLPVVIDGAEGIGVRVDGRPFSRGSRMLAVGLGLAR